MEQLSSALVECGKIFRNRKIAHNKFDKWREIEANRLAPKRLDYKNTLFA